MNRTARRTVTAVGAAALLAAGAPAAVAAQPDGTKTSFQMVRSAAVTAANCMPNANAYVTIRSKGPVEVMTVNASGLVPNAEYDLFVTQVPNAPFGLSWYQGDMESNSHGRAHGTFV